MASSKKTDRLQWFRDAKFGVFFHWGIIVMPPLSHYYWRMPYEEYKHLAGEFKPKKGWAREWMGLGESIYWLMSIAVGGGNLLYNICVKPNGGFPAKAPDPHDTVIALKIDGEV